MKMSLTSKMITLVAVLVCGSVVAHAEKIKVDSQETLLKLSASATSTLIDELGQAGALGFHVVTATARGNTEMVILLERDLKATEKLQLHLISTNATKTFEKEIAERAAEGYRAVGQTFLNKPVFLANEIVVIMERPVKPSKQYEYKLISTTQTSTFDSEWKAATRLGYKIIGSLTRGEVMLLMEREAK